MNATSPLAASPTGNSNAQFTDCDALVAEETSAGGGFSILWRSNSAANDSTVLYHRRFVLDSNQYVIAEPDGANPKAAAPVSDDPAWSGALIPDAALATDAEGNLIAIYSQANYGLADSELLLQRFNADNAAWDGIFPIDEIDASVRRRWRWTAKGASWWAPTARILRPAMARKARSCNGSTSQRCNRSRTASR